MSFIVRVPAEVASPPPVARDPGWHYEPSDRWGRQWWKEFQTLGSASETFAVLTADHATAELVWQAP